MLQFSFLLLGPAIVVFVSMMIWLRAKLMGYPGEQTIGHDGECVRYLWVTNSGTVYEPPVSVAHRIKPGGRNPFGGPTESHELRLPYFGIVLFGAGVVAFFTYALLLAVHAIFPVVANLLGVIGWLASAGIFLLFLGTQD